MKTQITLITLCLLAILVSVSAVSATNIYVNASATSGGTGTITNPFQNIQSGVTAASDGDTINIADGTYSGTGNNQITIDKNMNITGQSQNGTIINGTGTWIFYNNANNVTIQNLTFVNAGNGALYDDYGGAIYNNYYANMTINDCTFKENTAYGGGAIMNDGNMIINRCTFTNNTADYNGGAIFHCDGTMIISGCTFTNNTAGTNGYGYGGAIYTDSGLLANTIINNSIFDSNTAQYGGAIYNYFPITITGSNFNKNTATTNGGAIYTNSYYDDSSNVKYSRFVGNTAGTTAQDIYLYGGSIDARYNWWGSNNGPVAGRIAQSEGTPSNETYTPWLVMNINTDPSTIYTGETSKISVNVYTDSNGTDHSADAAQFFSGPEVTFTTDLGNVGSKEVTVPWTLGMAFAILRGDEGPGIATLTAADIETLPTTVTILQAPVNPDDNEEVIDPVIPTENEVNAASNTVEMQETGIPLAGLILAILAVFGGLLVPKRK
ncbi:hypothetical protein [Methanobacterium oryzae]|uniref:hypothetical protein n=1 Tax=Methanobacterium oryzae TaxID=69540 RepID=UPI003D21FAEB